MSVDQSEENTERQEERRGEERRGEERERERERERENIFFHSSVMLVVAAVCLAQLMSMSKLISVDKCRGG